MFLKQVLLQIVLLVQATAAESLYTYAANNPVATCSSLACVFSTRQRQNSTTLIAAGTSQSLFTYKIPTITITVTGTLRPSPPPPPSFTRPAPPLSPITNRPVPPPSPITNRPAPLSITSRPAPSSITSFTTNWITANTPLPTEYWSTCIEQTQFRCQNLQCTSIPGGLECQPWVVGEGPARELCIDGEPVLCEGSTCTAIIEEDPDPVCTSASPSRNPLIGASSFAPKSPTAPKPPTGPPVPIIPVPVPKSDGAPRVTPTARPPTARPNPTSPTIIMPQPASRSTESEYTPPYTPEYNPEYTSEYTPEYTPTDTPEYIQTATTVFTSAPSEIDWPEIFSSLSSEGYNVPSGFETLTRKAT